MKPPVDICAATSGEIAIELCRSNKPDLALLDIRMPGMTGIELANTLSVQFGIPFVFLTGADDQETINAATKTGALGYLVKPVEVSRLVPSIEIALMRSDERNALARNNDNLSFALENNRDIDIAVGILMGRYALDRAGAVDKLRDYARNKRIKISQVAKSVVDGKLIVLN